MKFFSLVMILIALGLNTFLGDGDDIGVLYSAFWIIVAIIDSRDC